MIEEEVFLTELPRPFCLVESEMRIIPWLLSGHGNVSIAEYLGISEYAVKHYITRIYKKCGAKTRSEAMAILSKIFVVPDQTVRIHPRILSDREREVATLISEGATNREISLSLQISEHTVKHHNHRIMRKLEICSRTDLARIMKLSEAN